MRFAILCLAAALSAKTALAQRQPPKTPPRDTGFAAIQERGKQAMGVDQNLSTHKFDSFPDGGRIELQSDTDDAADVAAIRTHIREIADAFKTGDFSKPAFVHMQMVPGTKTMAERRASISYAARDLPRGAELRIVSSDSAAIAAIHDFMAFQRGEHHAGGMHPPL